MTFTKTRRMGKFMTRDGVYLDTLVGGLLL